MLSIYHRFCRLEEPWRFLLFILVIVLIPLGSHFAFTFANPFMPLVFLEAELAILATYAFWARRPGRVKHHGR